MPFIEYSTYRKKIMKKPMIACVAAMSFLILVGCNGESDPASWSKSKIDKWFEKGDWLNGWTVKPDASVNRKALAVSYFKNRERWDKAFTFLKTCDLANAEAKLYDIDGDIVYAPVSEYITKNPEDAVFESHRKYIDIQYVIAGRELIGLAGPGDIQEVTKPYDEMTDAEFMTVRNSTEMQATTGKFFIFFPEDLHRPGVKDGENSPVRKVVIKVRVD